MCGGGRWELEREKKETQVPTQDAGQERESGEEEEKTKKQKNLQQQEWKKEREKGNLNLETKEPETCVCYFTDGTYNPLGASS